MSDHPSSPPTYKRILLKISGERLMGEETFGISPDALTRIAGDISQVHAQGLQICLVVGAGNIFRGINGAARGIDRATADYMGMLATVMNALALQNALEHLQVKARVMSAIPMQTVCETYIRQRAIRHLEKGRVVICAAGSGHPYFTTDTAAALRASEMNCDVLLKGTQVGGIFSADPLKNPDAQHYDEIPYSKVLEDRLQVMDATAIALARENKIPILVFSMQESGNMLRALNGEGEFSRVVADAD